MRFTMLLWSVLVSWLCSSIALDAAEKVVPSHLPDPDGEAPDTSRPVQVYILAGQSNMVGMGDVGGARCRYRGIYLTADPDAPKGPLYVHPVGEYAIAAHGVHTGVEPDAAPGATASVYAGAFDPAADYGRRVAVRTETVPLGRAKARLPTIDGPHTVVVRGAIDVPETGEYTLHVGHGESANNIARLSGEEVYRRDPGAEAVVQKVSLRAGARYPIEVVYFGGGSAALWLSREDLVGKGDLETVTRRDGKFPHLVDDSGAWTVRHDVHYHEARIGFAGAPLSATSNGRSIGPELGFGHVLGHFHDEQVLLIKTAMGNRALGYDFRPPSSGRKDPDSKWEGLEYRLMVEGVRKTLDGIGEILPGYEGQGYELAGFVWWQGHKDSFSPELIAEYEENLVHLIEDVREEFDAPKMPAVVATVGFGGARMADKFLEILTAQMAVSDPKRHAELAGTVASVDTRGFWREVDDSPTNQDYHYNRNAETYLLVGDALGRAMVELRGGKAEPTPVARVTADATDESGAGDPATDAEAAKAALAPIVLDGMAPAFAADPRNRAALRSEASGDAPKRSSQFLNGTMDGLVSIYRVAGVDDYDWRPFGPDLLNTEWEYLSFEPREELPREKANRFRAVTWPEGSERWFEPEFDAKAAGWRSGLPPFGQLDGQLEALSDTCTLSFCKCGEAPRTLWEHEVLLLRGTFELPPSKEGHRYRVVVGGSAHVNAGEGYAIYVNGELLAQSAVGVGKRQGAQPRGGHIFGPFRDELDGGPVCIAAVSFLRYNNPRGLLPPRGHISLWVEEAKTPPLGD